MVVLLEIFDGGLEILIFHNIMQIFYMLTDFLGLTLNHINKYGAQAKPPKT